jgi:hypothetical protein
MAFTYTLGMCMGNWQYRHFGQRIWEQSLEGIFRK